MTVKEFIDNGQPHDFVVVLRHDVDRAIKSAVKMAKLEANFDIRSTYYVRMTPATFKPAEISELAGLGHDVGYHYECLARAKGDVERAIQIFKAELDDFRKIATVHTISMHGSPLSAWNNLDIWNSCDYRSFDIIADLGLTIDYSNLYYFTDTGRNWDAGRYNIRDHTPSLKHPKPVRRTADLIEFLGSNANKPVFINTHPNRWSNSPAGWCVNAVSDYFINRVKWLISRSRKIAGIAL
jgi:hypothetical protein